MSPMELAELRKQLRELLEAGFIQLSKASYDAPILFQKKQYGTLRMCIDYRALNKVMIKNKYPVPLIQDLMDRWSRAEVFTKLDLRSGYWQFIVVYLYDIVIYSTNMVKHVEHLRRVFERLRQHKLYVKMEKCEFAQLEIRFLGYVVSKDQVHTDASDKAIGGVLIKEGHPVAFESRKLNGAEQRYSTYEKEMLAMVHCLDTWRVYLLGTRFVVRTDNVANKFFRTQKKLSAKQARWQEFLAEYDFVWEHKLGRHNNVADALSRKEVFAAFYSITRVESNLLE
ncbi:hypothetical protein K2173_010264 [Erythroxylum novogranatense]|uniref:Reverse transcriptase RNase H-like domain-containing protein n=1 Tax=Erythroxylum novogranatense TaxID=1862640 RepID=A0AAV8TEU2_9ROSI|nr:hypothetical protein K2173_010264 [Erythroxylum novogranatense]